MVSQGDYSPGHLGSMAYTVGKMLAYYPAHTLRPGDAMISNDPGIGSGHLPDMYMVCPVFLDETLIGFAVNIAHQIDIGGSGAGSQVVDGILDNYQEGIRFLPTMLYRAGEPIEEIFRIIEANVQDWLRAATARAKLNLREVRVLPDAATVSAGVMGLPEGAAGSGVSPHSSAMLPQPLRFRLVVEFRRLEAMALLVDMAKYEPLIAVDRLQFRTQSQPAVLELELRVLGWERRAVP
jgi:hypothetical protein